LSPPVMPLSGHSLRRRARPILMGMQNSPSVARAHLYASTPLRWSTPARPRLREMPVAGGGDFPSRRIGKPLPCPEDKIGSGWKVGALAGKWAVYDRK
jgi:hypothetical protein